MLYPNLKRFGYKHFYMTPSIKRQLLDIWHELGIKATDDLKTIKKSYASQLKKKRPDQDPQAYQQLRQAYELARAYAASQGSSYSQSGSSNQSMSSTQASNTTPADQEPVSDFVSLQAQVERLLNEVFNQPTQMAQAQALTARLEGESNLFIRAEVEEAVFDIGFAWPDDIQFPAYLYRRAAEIYHWTITDWQTLDLDDPLQRLFMRVQFEYEFRQAQSRSVSISLFAFLSSEQARSCFLLHRKCSPMLLYLCAFSGFGATEIKMFLQRLNLLYPLEKSSTFTTKAVLWWAEYFKDKSRLVLKHHVFAFVVAFIGSCLAMAFIARMLDWFVGGTTFFIVYLSGLILVSLYLKIRKK